MRWMLMPVLALMAGLAAAQSPFAPQYARAEAAFNAWLSERGLEGSLSMIRQGQPLHGIDAGLSPDVPLEMASLAKAITGVCAQQAVAQGRTDWTDSLRSLDLAPLDITLGQAVSQTSGIRTDMTHETMPGWRGAGPHAGGEVLFAVLDRGGPSAPPGAFYYSNENAALAALMLEAATGQDYETLCRDLALAPAGAKAAPSPATGRFLPFGGWSMSTSDYARFHAYWFADPARATQDPTATPHATLQADYYYGLGTFSRTLGPGNTFWHFGALCFADAPNTGSYAATLFNKWTLVAAWNGCVIDDASAIALDSSLTRALAKQ